MPIFSQVIPLRDFIQNLQDDADIGIIQMKVGREIFPNLQYMLHDRASGDAVLVDPGWDADLILDLLSRRKLHLRGIALTHAHIDHTAQAGRLSAATGVPVIGSRGCLVTTGVPTQRWRVVSQDTTILMGSIAVTALMTPGHTSSSVSYLIGDCLFPGDTIFIEGCGLATTPGGNARDLFRSCARLKADIPDQVRVFPGHEYARPVGATFAQVKAGNFHLKLGDEANFVAFSNRPRHGRTPPAVGSVPEMAAQVHDIPRLASNFRLKEAS